MGDRRPPPPIQEDRAPALMLLHTTRLCYLPRAMYAAYVAEDKGVVGRVNWQLLPRALKSFMGHYKSGPTKIGFTRHVGKPETGPSSRLIKKQRRSQGASHFYALACALVRAYPDDARQRVQARPEDSCQCNKPWVHCPDYVEVQG